MLDYYFGHQLYTATLVLFGAVVLNLLLAMALPVSRKWIGYTVLLFGVVLVLNLARYQYQLAFFGSRAEGVVVEIKVETGPSQNPNFRDPSFDYYPRIHFKTENGQQVEFLSVQGISKDDYSVGEAVKVRYMSAHPEFAEIDSFPSLWRPLLFASLFDGLICFIGVLILMKQARSLSETAARHSSHH